MNKEHFYKQAIMEHYNNSPHRGTIAHPSFYTDEISPSCGDRVVFDVLCKGDTIHAIKFRGEGSILGQAAASMLAEYSLNKSFEDVLRLTQDDILAWLGLDLGPTRKRTIVFVVQTLQKGIKEYRDARPNKTP